MDGEGPTEFRVFNGGANSKSRAEFLSLIVVLRACNHSVNFKAYMTNGSAGLTVFTNCQTYESETESFWTNYLKLINWSKRKLSSQFQFQPHIFYLHMKCSSKLILR